MVKKDTWEAMKVHLSNTTKYLEFNVMVFTDKEHTLAKQVHFSESDIQVARTCTNFVGHKWQFKQIQITLAYALTAHKSQSLRMDTVYLSLFQKVWIRIALHNDHQVIMVGQHHVRGGATT